MVGCETAAFLGEQNHDVTVIEFRDTVGADVIHEHRVYLMKDFEDTRSKRSQVQRYANSMRTA